MKKGILIILLSFFFQGILVSDPCKDLKVLYQAKRYEDAFRFIQEIDNWPCEEEEIRILKAKVLMANYRYSEALYELGNVNIAEAKELEVRINELIEISAQVNGAELKSSPLNRKGHENLKFNFAEVSLIDTQRVISEFPMEILSDTSFMPLSPNSNQVAHWLSSQNYAEIYPGSVVNDTLIWFSALIKRPFKKSPEHHELVQLKIQQLKKGSSLKIDTLGSAIHPCSGDGKIYFASDRSGGFGGYDIWSIDWDGKTASNLQNLGPKINTSFDEIFPALLNDELVFCSNRTDMNFGGFDFFKVDADGHVSNFGLPINSSYDDVNPIVHFGKLTSISSNRETLLYTIQDVSFTDTSLVFAELLGRVELEDRDISGKNLLVTSADSSIQQKVILDKDGYFRIRQLKGLTDYTIQVEGLDLSNSTGRLVLYNQKGDLVSDITLSKKGVFQLELLRPVDYYLEKEENEDQSVLSVDIQGNFENDAETKFVIALENSNGEIIGMTSTDSLGNFLFQSVNPDDNYTIRTEIKDPNGIIRIFNDKGETIQVIQPEEQNGYVYLRLSEDDRVITITNEENIAVKISELETFQLPTIYYDSDQSKLTEAGKESLGPFIELLKKNPGVFVEISGHTDSQGESRYNMELSQRRIESVLAYLTESGIDLVRISGKGYGETMLLNHCDDNTICSEEEHAINRRTELRIYQNSERPEP